MITAAPLNPRGAAGDGQGHRAEEVASAGLGAVA